MRANRTNKLPECREELEANVARIILWVVLVLALLCFGLYLSWET